MLEELRWAFWKPSTVVRPAADGALCSTTSPVRVSESTYEEWFSDRLRKEVRLIEERLAAVFGIRPEQCEQWQATRYHPGGTFEYHFDAGYWAHEPAGERDRTVLIYLQSPIEGGSTCFRELDLEIQPHAGRLVVWNNLLPNGERDPASIHAAAPVVRGMKTVLVTWTRERDVKPR
jgi:prolyl 4-hydroxylase